MSGLVERLQDARERYSGTIQDILAGLSLMAFIIMAGLYVGYWS